MKHSGRAHSKFSASGSERWFNCPGSVELQEGIPRKDNAWSLEGTHAHEVLEQLLRDTITSGGLDKYSLVTPVLVNAPCEMLSYGLSAVRFIWEVHQKHPGSEILVEDRVYLKFIHPEMFGTFDAAVLDHFGTLHVFDYKYGVGAVSPIENLQEIFYSIGLAHQYDWNFKRVRLWIIQPRVRGYDGPTFWEISITELRAYVDQFRRAIRRVAREPKAYAEGPWCHWCSAKGVCPLKAEVKLEKAIEVFTASPILRRETVFPV